MTVAPVDRPRIHGAVWPYDRDEIRRRAEDCHAIAITFTHGPGRPRFTVAFPTVGDAADFARAVDPWVKDVNLSTPVVKLDQPVIVVVRLLRPARDAIAALHRAKCAGCPLCRIPA